MLRLHLLGAIELRDGEGQEIRAVLAQPKRLALLAYLATVSAAGPVRRDTLLALFWPELDGERARNALSKGVHFLRQALGTDVISARSTAELTVDPARLWVDVAAFRSAAERDEHALALQHYRGDLLPAFYISGSPAFEQWLELERNVLRSHAARAARKLAEQLADARAHTGAIDKARLALELSDGDERTLRRVMALLDRLGDRATALRAYERFAQRLIAEVGGSPSPETVALADRIRAAPTGPRAPPATTVPQASPEGPPVRSLDGFTAAVAERYQVEGTLGAGGSAVVLLATDVKLRRKVAIKVLRPEVAESAGEARFRGEIFIAARLNHPHIVPLLDSGEAAGFLYYVMPWQSGESLRDRLEREGALPIRDALRIAAEVADALAAAHDRGVIHRDIKPENILLGSGHALLADFGIAHSADAVGGTGPWFGGGSGTPTYVSPEQANRQREVDGRSDVYALGCVLFEMLAGRPPFVGDSVDGLLSQHLDAPPPRLRDLRADTPAHVDDLVARALAKQATGRPSGAREFLQGLGELRTEGIGAARHWVGIAALLALVSTFGFWAMGRSVGLPPDQRPQLLVADVDAGADSLTGRGLTLALRADLAGSVNYQLVSPQRIAAALRRMGQDADAWLGDSLARELAIRKGIAMVARVALQRVQDRLLLVGEVVDPEGQVLGATRVTVDSEGVILDRLGDLSGRLRVIAGDHRSEVRARRPLPEVTTTSLAALRRFAEATTRVPGVAPPSDQIPLLEEAVALDSNFAIARRHLAVKYLQQRRFADGRRALAAALRLRDRMTPVEQGLLDATVQTWSGWSDSAGQRRALDRILEIDPQNWTAVVTRGAYETWQQRPAEGEAYADRALQIDSVHEGGWLLRFWARLGADDTAGAARALRDGVAHAGSAVPFLHDWGMYGWRTGDFTEVERLLDSLRAVPGVGASSREDLPIIGASVAYLRGHQQASAEEWQRFARRLSPERRAQILSSVLFRETQCRVLRGESPEVIARDLTPRLGEFRLGEMAPDDRVGAAYYLAGAWAWIGRTAPARHLLDDRPAPDSAIAPYLVISREFVRIMGLLGDRRDQEVVARAHAHNNSPLTAILELPLALAYDRLGVPDSAIAAGERFLHRRTFLALAADLSCAEQALRRRLGELYEARGDTARALAHYRIMAATWSDPDPALRPQVAEVRRRIARLTSTRLD